MSSIRKNTKFGRRADPWLRPSPTPAALTMPPGPSAVATPAALRKSRLFKQPSISCASDSSRTRLHDMIEKAAVADDLQGEVGQGHELDFGLARLVLDHAGVVIDLDLVAILDLVHGVRRLDQVEAAIDRVAVEDPRERSGDHGLHLGPADRPDRM